MSPMLFHNLIIKKGTILHKSHKYAITPSRKVEITTDELNQTSICIIQRTRK
jgi:hypothetical protein